jgi:hypothetical protein
MGGMSGSRPRQLAPQVKREPEDEQLEDAALPPKADVPAPMEAAAVIPRRVCSEPQFGHIKGSSALSRARSFSKLAPHSAQR